MLISIASLNSGSNGNCYYIGTENEGIFVDAGLSCRETEIRMKRLGLPLNRIKAIFVSHEHSDHILGISQLVSRYHIPVYTSQATLKEAGFWKIRKFVSHFTEQEPIQIGNFRVTAFPKKHDAIDPYSFVVSVSKTNIGIFTDIGKPCERLVHYFRQCHAAFLEANYDEEMLENGRYPVYLKNRIRGGEGHLSNREALALYLEHRPEFMSHLFLSHLSRENNSPELVESLFRQNASTTQVHIASRYRETELFQLEEKENPLRQFISKLRIPKQQQQLSLF